MKKYAVEIWIAAITTVVIGTLFMILVFSVGMSAFMWSGNDAIQFMTLGENVLAGNGFSLRSEAPFTPTALRTPGYPLFLAFSKAVSGGYYLVVFLQIIVYAALAVLAFRIAMMLFHTRWIGIASAAVMMVDIDAVYTALSLIADTLLAFFFILSLYFFMRYLERGRMREIVWSFVSLGLSAVMRPSTLVLAPLYLAALWWHHRRNPDRRLFLKRAAAGFFILFLFVAPWSARNYFRFGTIQPTTADAFALYPTLSAQIIALRDEVDDRDARAILVRNIEAQERDPKINLSAFPFKSLRGEILGVETFAYRDVLIGGFWDTVKSAPSAYAKIMVQGTAKYFTKTQWATPFLKWGVITNIPPPSRSYGEAYAESGAAGLIREFSSRLHCGAPCWVAFGANWFGRAFWTVMLLAAVFGWFYWYLVEPARRSVAVLVALAVVLTVLFGHVFYQGLAMQARYRIPIEPFLLAYGFYGLQILREQLKMKFP